MEGKRYFGPDCVRVMALCLLLWLHFFLRNGFYNNPVNTVPMTIAVAGRCVFMCCIPLFLMLTGYLKCAKEWSWKYYRSLIPILISWVMISVICLGYRILAAHESGTVYQWIVMFLDFGLAHYSWYIEMYIGLLLLSPFLNMAWNQLKDRRERQAMVGIFVFLTLLPRTVNGIKFDGEHALNPVPDYWSILYFFTYYLIGCYIRTYQPKVKRWIAIPAAAGIALVFAVINRYTGGEQSKFYDGYNISYGHLGTAAISVLLFLSVYQTRCRFRAVRKGMEAVSRVTLEMYLISCVFDQTIYRYQKGSYGAEEYWWRGTLACGLVFLLSFVSGWVIHRISVLADRKLTGLLMRKPVHGKAD